MTFSCRSSLGFKLQYRECHNDRVVYLLYYAQPPGWLRTDCFFFFFGLGRGAFPYHVSKSPVVGVGKDMSGLRGFLVLAGSLCESIR